MGNVQAGHIWGQVLIAKLLFPSLQIELAEGNGQHYGPCTLAKIHSLVSFKRIQKTG